jgi:hypothetical protein
MSRLTELEQTQSKIREEIRFLCNQDPSCDVPTPAAEKGYGQAMAGREKSAEEIIADLFTYHSPNPDTTQRYETIRDAAKHLALVIWKNCPYGADRTAAIRKLRETVMTANAAIALNGASLT